MVFFNLRKGYQTGFDPPDAWVGTPPELQPKHLVEDPGTTVSPTKNVGFAMLVSVQIDLVAQKKQHNMCSVNCSPMKYILTQMMCIFW